MLTHTQTHTRILLYTAAEAEEAAVQSLADVSWMVTSNVLSWRTRVGYTRPGDER